MVRPVPELCFWWAISQSRLGLLRSLGPLQGPGPADLFSGFAVSQSTSVSEPMPPTSKRCKCSLHRFFYKIVSSLNLTDWRTDSHIGQVEAGKMVRPVPELCVWWAISLLCLGLLRSDVLTTEPLSSVFFTEIAYSSSFIFSETAYFSSGLFYIDGIQMFFFVFDNSAYKFIVFFNDVI